MLTLEDLLLGMLVTVFSIGLGAVLCVFFLTSATSMMVDFYDYRESLERRVKERKNARPNRNQ